MVRSVCIIMNRSSGLEKQKEFDFLLIRFVFISNESGERRIKEALNIKEWE